MNVPNESARNDQPARSDAARVDGGVDSQRIKNTFPLAVIELVDGEKIIDLLENLELGLEKKETIVVFKIDDDFFKQYQLQGL